MIPCGSRSTITPTTLNFFKRVDFKSRPGGGQKGASWVDTFFFDIRDEFDLFHKLGVKFGIPHLHALALHFTTNIQ